MANPLKDKTILLGVTGSIAAYKAADLASKLRQAGAIVEVILTSGALQFITALTFQSVTGRKAYTDADLWGGEGHVTHISLGHAADLLVIAPATANTIARLAHGLGDNLLTVSALAASCPLMIAPAMDGGMFQHPSTQANLAILKDRGVHLIGPASGHLASGLSGPGRFVEPPEILERIRYLLGRSGELAGKKIVVSAGGTQERIDPVRVISNRSSGRQGIAIAQAALDFGADVTLICGVASAAPPAGCRLVQVQSAEEMLNAVLAETADADALIMAAAVADFRPLEISGEKIKKSSQPLFISLEPTSDILAEVASRKARSGFPRRMIGFAAESRDLIENARQKLKSKRLDLIVANDITAEDAGFEVGTNRVTLLFADGRCDSLPLLTKAEVAEIIIQQVSSWLASH